MKKNVVFLLVLVISMPSVIFAFSQKEIEQMDAIVYPENPIILTKLQPIIQKHFSYTTSGGIGCIKQYCPKKSYNSIHEKSIKMIIASTFAGNETFYTTTFLQKAGSLQEVLDSVPKGNPLAWSNGFHTIGANIFFYLLQESFGAIHAPAGKEVYIQQITAIIEQEKQRKCKKFFDNPDCATAPGNAYLPTKEELHHLLRSIDGDGVNIISYHVSATPILYTTKENDTIAIYPKNTTYTINYHGDETMSMQEAKEKITHIQTKKYKITKKHHAEIPKIFTLVPHNRMVIYVQNPLSLASLVYHSDNNALLQIKKWVSEVFDMHTIEQIQKNLQHEMLIVVNSFNTTTPDIVFIFQEADSVIVSSLQDNFISKKKDGFIFITHENTDLTPFLELLPNNSIAQSPNFLSLWGNIATGHNDPILYTENSFFTNITALQTFLQIRKKWGTIQHIYNIQESLWACQDVFGIQKGDIHALSTCGANKQAALLSDKNYTINSDNIVEHTIYGTSMQSKNIPELTTITKEEFHAYVSYIQQHPAILHTILSPTSDIFYTKNDNSTIDFRIAPTNSDETKENIAPITDGENTPPTAASFLTSIDTIAGGLMHMTGILRKYALIVIGIIIGGFTIFVIIPGIRKYQKYKAFYGHAYKENPSENANASGEAQEVATLTSITSNKNPPNIDLTPR